jgi:plasmid stability protein
MSVNLSIKNVPDELADRLRERAKRNHRSLQGELLAVLEAALKPQGITVEELHRRGKALGLRGASESVAMIREDRDAR